MNRETWLQIAAEHMIQKCFIPVGVDVPKFRVSVGFPGGGSPKKRIGEHWHPRASDDKISQIFISPILKTSISHLETLMHEIVHACVPDAGHGKPFKLIALKVGLTGKMRATTSTPELTERLNVIIGVLGEIPHSGLNLSDRKKQTTRMVKMQCPACEYIVRAARKTIEEKGLVICPCNNQHMELK